MDEREMGRQKYMNAKFTVSAICLICVLYPVLYYCITFIFVTSELMYIVMVIFFNNDVRKIVYSRLSWNEVFWNQGYDLKIFVHNVTNNISSSDSIYILDSVMSLKFGNSSISLNEVNRFNLNFMKIRSENKNFEMCSCFKFNKLGQTLKSWP